MLRRSRGFILVFSTIVFMLVIVVAISCSALIFSGSKYSKYNYKSVYMDEVCHSNVELVYSRIIEKIQNILDNCDSYEEFENQLNDSFIEKITIEPLKNSICELYLSEDLYQSEDAVYFRILSKYIDKNFERQISAYVKIINPFEKNTKITDETIEEINKTEEDNSISEDSSISEDTSNYEEAPEDENNYKKQEINSRDIVKIISYKEG